MKSKHFVFVLSSLIVLSTISTLFVGCEKREVPEGTLLSVFYSSDVRGKLEGCGCKRNGGGITKRAAKLAAAHQEDPQIIYCDAGNFMTGQPYSESSEGMVMVKAYNHMGTNVVNVSERELALGYDAFKKAKANSDFDYVSANVKFNGSSVADDYVIKKFKDAKVAFVGLCGTKEIMRYDSTHLPAGIEIVDPMVAARNVLPSLANKADVVIVLSTCGDETDSLLADHFEFVNLIIGGRSFRANEDKPWIVGDTRIVRANRDGKTLGRMDLVFGPEGKIKTYSPSKVTMETSDPSDESMLALVRQYLPDFVDNPKDGVRIKKTAEAVPNTQVKNSK
ncbi:bifunctional metallophosphatase/5'-nucleotidase [bacterium]|nr:MAG: bifunctional metallophosphatase/5'-nucleotidase [bacterium]